jgi:hypothetical protein
VARGDFEPQWESLLDVLGRLDPPLRPAGPFVATGRPPTPKRQRRTVGGKDAWAMFPIDQPAMNRLLDRQLRASGWHRQPVVADKLVAGPVPSGLLGDFAKDGIFVEVEFGNIASLYRDLFKFQMAGRSGAGEVGVVVVATDRVAKFFDQGVATFEQASNLLPYLAIGLQLPTVIIGLDLTADGWLRVRERYDEMRTVCEAQGLATHSFEAVFGAPDQITLEEV